MSAALALTTLATVAGVACGGDDGPAKPASTVVAARTSSQGGDAKITVSDNKFEPAAGTVKVNNEAIWEWKGNNPHQVVGTFQGEKVESLRLTGAGTFIFSFSKAGTFSYQCGVHGASMSGRIKVE